MWSWKLQRQNHLHVNDIVHGEKWKCRVMWKSFLRERELCSQISSRSLVILGTWIWKEIVRKLLWHAWWSLGQKLLRKWWWTSQKPPIRFPCFQRPWKKRSTWSFGNERNSHWISYCRPSNRWTATAKPAPKIRATTRTTIWRPRIIQTVLQRGFENCRKKTIFHHTWYTRTERNGAFIQRNYAAS